MSEEHVDVLGGVLHGRRVRWDGPELRAVKPTSPVAYVPEMAGKLPPSVEIPTDRYVTWRSEDGRRCYIEEGLAKQITEERDRADALAGLTAALTEEPGMFGPSGDGVPDPRVLDAFHMRGEAWWCGDEVCDCTQAQIVGWDHTEDGWRRGYRTLWRGPFHSDGESGADEELRACCRYLTLYAPTVAARIKWADAADWSVAGGET